MRGKICMITGANSGIGAATARKLATMGATVVAVCREQTSGQAALAEIKKASPDQQGELLLADLSSLASVRQLAADFKRSHAQLHVLINNAGVMRTEYARTVDGYEMTFAVNQLAPFLLTNLLLDELTASNAGRVISLMGNSGPINFDDLMGEKHYDMMNAYQQSKQANRLFVIELAKHTGLTANGADPGFVASNLGRDAQGSFKSFLESARPTMRTADQGAEMSVYVASAPELEGVSGKVFASKRGEPASRGAKDEAEAKRLWDVCEKLTGVSA